MPDSRPIPRTWLITRHPGAIDWARESGLVWDRLEAHLSADTVAAGDRVYGVLPLPLAAELCARGAEVWHLCIPVTAAERGRELSAAELNRLGARFRRFHVEVVDEQ